MAFIWENDGYQVFAAEGGTFGAVFLVHSDEDEQILKVEVGYKGKDKPQLVLEPLNDDRFPGGIAIGESQGKNGPTLIFPGSRDGKPASWKRRSTWPSFLGLVLSTNHCLIGHSFQSLKPG